MAVVDSNKDGNDSDDELKKFAHLSLEPGDMFEEDDYYVHIDILEQTYRHRVGTAINKFMIQNDAYDPRRGQTFPRDILVNLPNTKDTLKARRDLTGHGCGYYELWRVRRTFSVGAFHNMLAALNANHTPVRLVRIISNDHEITIHHTN